MSSGKTMILIASLFFPQLQADEAQQAMPSKALLNFLADFGEVDVTTYDLIEFHALRDVQQEQPGHSEHTTEETSGESE